MPLPLPSAYLGRRSQQRCSNKGKAKAVFYERDIICLPSSYKEQGTIKIPRSQKVCDFLARNGLIGKINLSSAMSEQIMDEIVSVFMGPMRNNHAFRFAVLQPSGGSSKSLMVPALSASFHWSASSVVGKNAKVPIYILAEDELKVPIWFG